MIILRVIRRILATFFSSEMTMEHYFFFWIITTPVVVLAWWITMITIHKTNIDYCYLNSKNEHSVIVEGHRNFVSDQNIAEFHTNEDALEFMNKLSFCPR